MAKSGMLFIGFDPLVVRMLLLPIAKKRVCLSLKPDWSLYFTIPGEMKIKPLNQPGRRTMESRLSNSDGLFSKSGNVVGVSNRD